MTDTSNAVEVGGAFAAAVFVALVLTVLAVTVIVVARPWELRGGRFADKLRIGDAVSRYDFWLGLRGVGVRRRRALRAELRANLWEATGRVGVKAALDAVGPTRELASGTAPDPAGPRWGLGVALGLVAVEVFVMFQVFVGSVVVDTARAAGVAKVDVAVSLVPGMRAFYEKAGDGLSVGMEPGPAPLVAGVLAFLVVARPWRLLRRTAPATA